MRKTRVATARVARSPSLHLLCKKKKEREKTQKHKAKREKNLTTGRTEGNCNQGMVWNGMEDDFSIFHTGNFLPFHFHSIPKIFHSILKFSSIFHSILKFSSIFHSIPSYQRNFRLEVIQRIFCCFAPLQCCKQPLVRYADNTKMQRLVSGMHIAHGLMHRRSLDFELGGGLNRKSCNDVIRSP